MTVQERINISLKIANMQGNLIFDSETGGVYEEKANRNCKEGEANAIIISEIENGDPIEYTIFKIRGKYLETLWHDDGMHDEDECSIDSICLKKNELKNISSGLDVIKLAESIGTIYGD